MRTGYHFSGAYYSGLGCGSSGGACLVLGLLLFVFGIVTLLDAFEDVKNRKRYLDAILKTVFVLGGMAGGVLLGLFLGSLSPYGFAAILVGFFVGLCLGGGLGGLLGNLAAKVTAICCDDCCVGGKPEPDVPPTSRPNSYGEVDVGEPVVNLPPLVSPSYARGAAGPAFFTGFPVYPPNVPYGDAVPDRAGLVEVRGAKEEDYAGGSSSVSPFPKQLAYSGL